MERTGRASDPAGRTVARWAVLCALLLGLFLMHGSPASAAGCHRTTESPAAAHHTAAHADEGSARAAVRAPGAHEGAAVDCLATPARDRLPHTAPPAAVPWSHPQPVAADPLHATAAGGGRAPPDGGRDLLLRICVARR
ncbi:hypothetical protein [Kitasatospora sp. CB01950]|uniref:hypothetical protein n=1 Tax=Kitasatospora sp. CB01950 TaxID=1703930 RepID=UPI00093C263F|nr:hypothetical protein [Kitasatospora sp. CB01950]